MRFGSRDYGPATGRWTARDGRSLWRRQRPLCLQRWRSAESDQSVRPIGNDCSSTRAMDYTVPPRPRGSGRVQDYWNYYSQCAIPTGSAKTSISTASQTVMQLHAVSTDGAQLGRTARCANGPTGSERVTHGLTAGRIWMQTPMGGLDQTLIALLGASRCGLGRCQDSLAARYCDAVETHANMVGSGTAPCHCGHDL